MIRGTFSMNNVLLVSQNKDIETHIEKVISENTFGINFRLETCSNFQKAENLLANKDFFVVLIDTALCNDLCIEIHKLSFLARHDVYVLGIGTDIPYEDISRLVKCGLSDFIKTCDISSYVKELFELASKVSGKDNNSILSFKKIFMPASLDSIIFSSLVHEIRNNNNIASLNIEMVKNILKRTKGDMDSEQKDDIVQYAERSLTGIWRTTEMVEAFSYINKVQQSSMGSASDFAVSLENVQKCFHHRFRRIYTEVEEDFSVKIPILKINQRDIYRVILNMFYLAGISISESSKTLKIATFKEGKDCGFSLAFYEAFLYKGYFDNGQNKHLLLAKEYLCCLDILKGFVSLYGGSFVFEEVKDGYSKLKLGFSSKYFLSAKGAV